jgi:hypothetical protein
LGAAWVIAGGLVAAVTGPLNLEHGSWAAAFCVLVGGVAQYTIGVVQPALTPREPSRRFIAAEATAWNAGAIAVVIGTVAGMPFVVHVGGLLIIVALVLMVRMTRGAKAGPVWAVWTYRILLVVILVSVPIGLTLAHVRAG